MNKFHKITIAKGDSAILNLSIGVSALAVTNANGKEGGEDNIFIAELGYYNGGIIIELNKNENLRTFNQIQRYENNEFELQIN